MSATVERVISTDVESTRNEPDLSEEQCQSETEIHTSVSDRYLTSGFSRRPISTFGDANLFSESFTHSDESGEFEQWETDSEDSSCDESNSERLLSRCPSRSSTRENKKRFETGGGDEGNAKDVVVDEQNQCLFDDAFIHTRDLLDVEYSLSDDHTDDCICSRLTDLNVSNKLCGWKKEPNDEDVNEIKNKHSKKNRIKFFGTGYKDEIEFTFKHYADSKEYIEQYRRCHVSGWKRGEIPIFGLNAPDPYISKIKNISFLFNRIELLTAVSSGCQGRNRYRSDLIDMASYKNRRASIPSTMENENGSSLMVTNGCCSPSSAESSPRGGESCPDDLNLAPIRKVTGRKQFADSSYYYLDLATPRTNFSLVPTQNSKNNTPTDTMNEENRGFTYERVATPLPVVRTSQEIAIATLQRQAVIDSTISSKVLNVVSDPNVYEKYLQKLRTLEPETGTLVLGKPYSITDPQNTPKSTRDTKNMQVGLCEVYSSGIHQLPILAKPVPPNLVTVNNQNPLSKLDVRGCQIKRQTSLVGTTKRRKQLPVPVQRRYHWTSMKQTKLGN
ncbi:uncharacterized protein LOC141899089 [Tubulanus polymorphus]|uniref:uncharacterized protein LOC141899089 n=1 Tax=Tubulanus polymorphus TaxID=672921 RepID=UPI003DA217DE